MDAILSRAAWAVARKLMVTTDKVVILKHDAALAVDISKTFMPGGGLPVRFGDKVVPVARRMLHRWPNKLRFATKEGHPHGHVSLASSFVGYADYYMLTYEEVRNWTSDNHRIAPHALFTLRELKFYLKRVGYQVLWPDHGLAGTEETQVHPDLAPDSLLYIHTKGTRPCRDSYGAMEDALGRSNGFNIRLRRHRVKRVFVFGLAFDFCVGDTAIQLAKLGYEVFIVIDATRSVKLPAKGDYPGSEIAMLQRLEKAGVKLVRAKQLLLAS